jgi:hypothetical protein
LVCHLLSDKQGRTLRWRLSGTRSEVTGDDRQVGLGKVEGGEFAGGNPTQCGVFVRLGFLAVGCEPDDEGDQLHGDRGVGVGMRRERTEDVDGYAEFFLQLAVEGGFGGFAGLDLAAGKFPFSAEVFVRGALGHEHAAVFFDESADDEERGTEIGHTDFNVELRKSGIKPAGQRECGEGFPDFLISRFHSGVLGCLQYGQSGSR